MKVDLRYKGGSIINDKYAFIDGKLFRIVLSDRLPCNKCVFDHNLCFNTPILPTYVKYKGLVYHCSPFKVRCAAILNALSDRRKGKYVYFSPIKDEEFSLYMSKYSIKLSRNDVLIPRSYNITDRYKELDTGNISINGKRYSRIEGKLCKGCAFSKYLSRFNGSVCNFLVYDGSSIKHPCLNEEFILVEI